MRNIRVLLTCLTLALLSCGGEPKKPQAEGPPGAAAFETQVMKFIEKGTETNAKTSQGVPHADLRAQIVNTKAAYDLMLAVWPEAFAADARDDFGRAIEGWELALELWDLKINKADNPSEPDINRFDRYVVYGSEAMEVEQYSKDYLVKAYRGKRYLPFDANIEVLLKVAGTWFNTGRNKILGALEEKSGAG